MTPLSWAVPLLSCPRCGGALRAEMDGDHPDQGFLFQADGACDEVYPIIDGVPRLLVGADRAALAAARSAWFELTPERRRLQTRWSGPVAGDRVVRGFDDEWARFSDVTSPALEGVFDLYFDLVPSGLMTEGRVVLDAGCGAGRWAIQLAARGPNVLAVDRGLSAELAARNAAGSDRVACVQADLRTLPVRPSSLDWAYSLGVIHHIDDPAVALSNIVRAVRPGGLVLLYLYYALEGRGPVFRAIFSAVDAVRRTTSLWPRALLVPFSSAIAVLVYWPLARVSELLARAGLRRIADALPLSFYRGRPLWIMRNDSLDRFGTAVEVRYRKDEMRRLMEGAGLSAIRFSPAPPYSHATGTRE